jgi:diaminopimelate epimerase
MMLHFYKYHGTGNDFILVDGREGLTNLTSEQIKKLCHRRFGVGTDGLMILKNIPDFDFQMNYYNSDGSGGTMCGNGGRCIVAFAKHLGIIGNETRFLASDGPHLASIDNQGLVKLKMLDVDYIKETETYSFLNTGSPHHVKFVENADLVNVIEEGKKIRYSDDYKPGGTNVNFVSECDSGIYVRTYERGVEDETYSCGTGSVASAIAYYSRNNSIGTKIPVKTLGGLLEISFDAIDGKFINVYLKGPAKFVFEGKIEINGL